MISQTTIQTLRELPLESAMSIYVPDLKKKGVTYVGKSPFNDETTPSFHVHPAKGFWKDFSSGKGGRDVVSFLMQFKGIDFLEAVKLAAADNNVMLEYDSPEQAEKYKAENDKRARMVPALDWAFSEFAKNEVVEDFLQRFPKTVCDQFNLSFCTGLVNEAKKSNQDLTLLAELGLIGINQTEANNEQPTTNNYYERFLNRIIFPIYDFRNNLIGFTGRVKGDAPKGTPKYLHSSFEKSKTLFAIHKASEAMRKANNVFVVEGPTDCMRFHQMNHSNAVAMQGSDFSEDQCKLVKRFCSEVTIVADNDEPGLKALQRNAETALANGLTVKVLIPKK